MAQGSAPQTGLREQLTLVDALPEEIVISLGLHL
jgi:hypothetical protein